MARYVITLLFIAGITLSCQTQNTALPLKIAIRGNMPVNLAVVPTTGEKAYQPLIVKEMVMPNMPVSFSISTSLLPADFQLRVEFRNPSSGQPQVEEIQFFMDKDPVEISVNPLFMPNPDSTRFAADDKNNLTYQAFMRETGRSREMINMLQSLLMRYDRKNSPFYNEALKEYQLRVDEHNRYVATQYQKHKDLFAASTFPLYSIAPYDFSKPEAEAQKLWLKNYISSYNFSDPRVVKTSDFRKWLDSYVNRHFDKNLTRRQTDSVLASAGEVALKAAIQGKAEVCGRVIDYFYNGYESMGYTQGVVMLGKYIDDKKCPATKKLNIEYRIESLSKIFVGAEAPDFSYTNTQGISNDFSVFGNDKPYKILLFWSADCSHCIEFVNQFYPFYERANLKQWANVLAVSLDQTETEIPVWEKAKNQFPLWEHTRLQQGLSSPEARAYYVLSTPTLFIVESGTGKIAAMPQSVRDIFEFWQNHQ